MMAIQRDDPVDAANRGATPSDKRVQRTRSRVRRLAGGDRKRRAAQRAAGAAARKSEA